MFEKEEYLNAKYVTENPKGYHIGDVKAAAIEVDKWEFANQKVIDELESLTEDIYDRDSQITVDNKIKELKQ